MGHRGDPTAVVDADGLVAGLTDRLVADVSVIPVTPHAGTNLTAILLGWCVAERGAGRGPRVLMPGVSLLERGHSERSFSALSRCRRAGTARSGRPDRGCGKRAAPAGAGRRCCSIVLQHQDRHG